MNLRSALRAVLYQTEKQIQRARFARTQVTLKNLGSEGWPILLGISFPKSGTHLLDQILLGFSKVAPFAKRLHSFYAEYEGRTGRKRAPEQALAWLDSLRPLDVASAHLFARPGAVSRVTSGGFIPYFIFRDPRDVVVSHAFYVTEMETRHIHHDYYQSLPDFEARLKVSLLGRPDSDVEFPNLAERFAPYLGWLDCPEVLALHFEDLIHARAETLSRIAKHLETRAPLNVGHERVVAALEASIHPSKSPTFRSGKTGEWRKYFTEEHKRIFKDVAGDLLIRLGYEKDAGW